MQNAALNIPYSIFNSMQELPLTDRVLFEKAIEAAKNAYAPYSNFRVGASVELKTREIVTGNNQENVASPSGLCAERVALFAAGAHHPHTAIQSVAIVAIDSEGNIVPASPCGACRQVIAEYEMIHKNPIHIIFLSQENSIIRVQSIDALLPFGFNRVGHK